MEQYYVGLDVHGKAGVFVIQDADGTVVARGAGPLALAPLRAACNPPGQRRMGPGAPRCKLGR